MPSWDRKPVTAKPPIFLLGEAMGENEKKIGAGFVGSSGIELLRMMDEANLIELTAEDRSFLSKYYDTSNPTHIDMIWRLHPEVHRSNVFQQHPPGNRIEAFCGGKTEAIYGYPALIKGKYVRKEFQHELERLGDELVSINPNLIVCLGNSALWAMAGKTGVSKLRGTTSVSTHTVDGFKLLSTYHPAAVLRQWELRPITVIDLMKAAREAEYPEVRRPKREIWIEPGIEDIERFVDAHVLGCRILSVDIETSGSRVTCIGFSPSSSLAIVIPFDDTRAKSRSYWNDVKIERTAWLLVRRVLEDKSIRKSFQNGLYDIAFLWRAYGIPVLGAAEDTMLLHHSLQPESLKGLGFLGSIYTDEGSWKSDRKGTETIKRDE
jgi:uracil-DNA glycosylase